MQSTVECAGRTVHRIGYGCMRITGPGIWGEPVDRDGAREVLRRAAELGVTLFDTADSYGPFVTEDLLREVLHPYDGLVIATKGGFTRQGPDRWSMLGEPGYLRQCVEMSLRRLGVERLDLWQLHRIDPAYPADDQFGVIADLIAEGKIAAAGLSEVTVDDIDRASRHFPVASVQNLYNVASRASDPVLDACESRGIPFLAFFPVARGGLAERGGALDSIAQQHGATPAQVALSWLLHRSPVLVPIPGTTSLPHLEENLGAARLSLSARDLADIEAAVPTASAEAAPPR